MDFYAYYRERFEWGCNPYAAVARCQQTVTEMLDNPHIPTRIAAESAVGFLAALADFAGDGCTVTMAYTTIMNSLIGDLQWMRDATEARDRAWRQEMMKAEQEAGGAPIYDPGEYEVWLVDVEGEEPDNEPEEEPAAVCIAELYGTDGEPGTTGTRRPFPDWEHADKWTQEDWAKLQIHKSKVLAPIGHSFDYMRPAIDTLAAIELHIRRLPISKQAELFALAAEIVSGLKNGLESDLQTLRTGLTCSCQEDKHN